MKSLRAASTHISRPLRPNRPPVAHSNRRPASEIANLQPRKTLKSPEGIGRVTIVGEGRKQSRTVFFGKTTVDLHQKYILAFWLYPCAATAIISISCDRLLWGKSRAIGLHKRRLRIHASCACRRSRSQKHRPPHGCRHSFAKEWFSNNGDIKAFTDLLGHSNINTTAPICNTTRDEMAAQYAFFASGVS